MSNPIVESLQIGEKKDSLTSYQIKNHVSAIKELTLVAQVQSMSYQNSYPRSVESKNRCHSYFYSPELNGVISISVFRPYDEEKPGVITLSMSSQNDDGEIIIPVLLVLNRLTEQINSTDALELSQYTPKQLLQIAELIRTANHIPQQSYQSYFQELEVPSGLEM